MTQLDIKVWCPKPVFRYNEISAGKDINVILESSMSDPQASGSPGKVKVAVNGSFDDYLADPEVVLR